MLVKVWWCQPRDGGNGRVFINFDQDVEIEMSGEITDSSVHSQLGYREM